MPIFIYHQFSLISLKGWIIMAEKDIKEVLDEKGRDLKKMFRDMQATLEQWKFSIEETKEGIRVEIHATALIKRTKAPKND